MAWECRYCGIVGTCSQISKTGSHHEDDCPRYELQCDRCEATGSLEDLRDTHNHRFLQDCCCPRSNGARFRCCKANCPMKFVVMYENVWAVYPDTVVVHAHRGPNHTVRHRPQYHDYWCELIRDGNVSASSFESEEYSKISSEYDRELRKEQTALHHFGIGLERLFTLLPSPTSKTAFAVESDSIVNASAPVVPLMRFHDKASLRASLGALEKARGLFSSALYSLKALVGQIHFARCIRSQLSSQKLAHAGEPVTLLFLFVGLESILHAPIATNYGYGISFKIQEKMDEANIPNETCEEASMEPCAEDVIQYIEHDEPAAERDPAVLLEQARHDDADMLTALLHGRSADGAFNSTEPALQVETETVSLLAYGRYPESFRSALSNGVALHPCRTALDEAGFPWLHESGAKIFVHPWQFEDSMAALSRNDVNLRPYHVVVSTSLEYNVQACLEDIPCREGARVKRRRVIEHVALENPHGDVEGEPNERTRIEDSADQAILEFEVQRTFLCESTRRRQPNSVTQSTTEVHGGGMNPRRAMQSMSAGSH